MSKAWHQQDIVAAVKKRGSSLSQLAVEHGYKRGSLHRSLYKRYPKAHAIIAAFLGVPRSTIWPQWYDAADRLLPLTPYQRRRAGSSAERRAA